MAQMALVVLPATSHARAQAQFFQQVLHLGRIIARQGKVVRALWAGQAIHLASATIAAGGVLQLQHGEVIHALQTQGACSGQASHATACNQNPCLVNFAG